MKQRLYYTPPTNEQFVELKEKAIQLWNNYSNDGGYRNEKLERIQDLKNIGDNFMYIVAMFDFQNQQLLAKSLSKKTRKAVSDRMIDGGNPPLYNPFLA